MNAREFKDNIYNEIASVSKALANSHRLEIVELLAQGPSSVEYVAEQSNLSVASASHHLQTLKKARLVSTKKKGKYRYYSLSNQHVFEVWRAMRELAFSQNAEINKLIGDYRKSQNNLESITIEELKKRLQEGNALLIDVRPGQEYEAGHITSSLSVPKDELHRRLKDLPKDKEIVTYCRGPLCTMADEAVAELRQKGYKATKLDVGYPEWQIAKA
jgi:rhodanese-related sulfurtransferase/DNA-binding transcriptional ArsR family regulator